MNKKIVKAMFTFAASKEEIRPLFKGVHFAEDECVASDTHILVVYKEANPKLVGKTIGLDGTEIKGKYPAYKRLIPKKPDTAVAVNWKQVYDAIKWYKRQPDHHVNDMVVIGGTHIGFGFLLNLLEVFNTAGELPILKGYTFAPERPMLLESDSLSAIIMPCGPEDEKIDLERGYCESVIMSYENFINTYAIESRRPKPVVEEMAWL